jgi:RNA polymerase sigma-70 factor, ECF subfamily
MTEQAALLFEEHRPFLTKLACRIAGNWSDAEELVAHAFLRWKEVDHAGVANAKAFLATTITRLAINHKRSARVRLELLVEPEGVGQIKDESAEEVGGLADALSNAFEIVLSKLSPIERVVFLLREVFQMEYGEISGLLDESEANCRQILKRSREKIASPKNRFPINETFCELAIERFLRASRDGKLDELMEFVAPGVVLMRDPGDIGLPSPPPLHGIDAVTGHFQSYIERRGASSWECFRIGENYQIATLRGEATVPISAVICVVDDNRQFTQVDHITCPTRLSMLLKLFGTRE